MEIQRNKQIQGIWLHSSAEAWIGVNLKILCLIYVLLAGIVVAAWSVALEAAGLNPFNGKYLSQWIRWKHLGKIELVRISETWN